MKKVNFGQWTFNGKSLTCKSYGYELYKHNFLSDTNWIDFMADKRWCNQSDFKKGYEYACKFWGINPNK